METQRVPTHSSYGESSDAMQQPLRVDPNYPLPSSLPPSQDTELSPLTNGTARTTSRRRRPSGSGPARTPIDHSSQPPAAPEVPRAPPISYRPAHGSENYDRSKGSYPASFAERARALTGNSISTKPSESDPEPSAQPAKPVRRGSLNRPIGGVYSEIQQHKRDSYPPVNGPISPRRFSNSTSPQQYQATDPYPAYRRVSSGTDQQYNDATSNVPETSNRRASAGLVQPPKKEWAPDRSPLQKLEVKLSDISKEEKRARMQEAEQRLRDSQGFDRRRSSRQEGERGVDRTQSKRASANSGAAKQRGLSDQTQGLQFPTHVQQPEAYTQDSPPDPRPKETSRIPRPERRRDSFPIGSTSQRNSSLPVARDLSRRTSAQAPETPRERGVRFQGEDETEDFGDYPQRSSNADLRDRRRSSGTEALARSDQVHGARREKLRQDPSTMTNQSSSKELPKQQQELYSSKAETSENTTSAATFGGVPDPVPRHTVQGHSQGTKYKIPPQTAGGIQARQAVGFGSRPEGAVAAPAHRKHHLSKILHRDHDHAMETSEQFGTRPKQLDEWRRAGTARLTAADFDVESDSEKGQGAWWEKRTSGSRRKQGRAANMVTRDAQSLSGDYQNNTVPALTAFEPRLYLKCGPLLRYTGLKRDRLQTTTRNGGSSSAERETWRGSVMIVTTDADSIIEPVPTLRLFSEPMELLPSPQPYTDEEDDQEVSSEFIDPIAGLPKLSRSGRTVYVKPVDDLEQGRDLSRFEDDDGLFEETRTAAVPTAYGTPDYRPGRNGPAPSANPKAGRGEGRTRKKGQQVKGVRLHAECGVTFWRFNLEVELGPQQSRIAYSINNCPAIGFWVPARGHSMNMMFHSCNGFSKSVNPDNFSGPDPLWRDVLNSHQTRPFHVMIGGGDQIYNDAVMTQSPLFREWLEIKNPHHKHDAHFSPSMREELETFYLERYSMWFSQGLFGMANSQIPMVNMWDDHDIIDGFGSYPHHFMSTPVFCGLGAVAFKYYMLFQHQSVPDEGPADEPSWLMGAAPGPYISELSRSIFLSLGKNVSLLAIDCRTERMREEILSEASYELVFERCRREIIEGETKHLIVLLGVPIAYPRLVWLENLLTSSVMAPIKALGRAGMLGGFLNKFDGGVEILDDLDDHWTARNHKQERNWFVQELQELAAEKSVRVTILGGDVHLAAVGQFYSNPNLGVPKDRDHRYMTNIVSSAIVNTPPSNNMADILNRRNKTHHFDHETDEDMIPMFTHDVNGHPRNNKHLLPRRNWCSIREYHPGTSPPPTPPESEPQTPSDESPPPPTRLQRTLSLTRGDVKPGNLLRRFSKNGPPPSDDYLHEMRANRDKLSDSQSPESPQNDGYFPQQTDLPKRAATINGNGGQRRSSAPLPHPGGFHRHPTNMSEKAATKGGANDNDGLINLEHGLDVVLNCEVNQKDPAGHTVPYRLIIPALYYEGHGDENTVSYRKKSLISRLGSIRGKRINTIASGQGQGNWGQDDSVTPSLSEGEEEGVRPRRWSFSVSQRRQYRDQTPPLSREREHEIGDEGIQQQRQYEDRNQQIGQAQRPAPFKMPSRQQRKFSEPSTPLGQSDQYDGGRQDSADFHAHLDSSPSGGGSGYPGRRLYKVDRMLGVGNVQRSKSNSVGNGDGNGRVVLALADNQKGGYNSEDYDEIEPEHIGQQGKKLSQGYSGIEAYSEKSDGKGWRRFFGS